MIVPYKKGKNYFCVNPEFFGSIKVKHFKEEFWKKKGAIVGKANGRNTALFVQHREHELLLRHYYRGGWIEKFNRDRFLYQRPLRSRAIREFQLLVLMRERGLPVPRPCAARMRRRGLLYRADILVERIPDSQDLFEILKTKRSLTVGEWQQVGRTIASFHLYNIFHSDLNCHNILLDANGKVWIVDFDKCGIRTHGSWKMRNLKRLLRSFNKEKGRTKNFHWEERDWDHLIAGYRSAESGASW